MVVRRVIAIAGGSGSGKSTLAAALLEAMGNDSVALLPIDAYYHDLSHLAPEEREAINFDHPDALDLDLFTAHIEALRSGRAVECPTYDSPRTADDQRPSALRRDRPFSWRASWSPAGPTCGR